MKKVLFAVMAMIAIGFTSCGNKTQASTEAGTEVTVSADDEAAATIDALTEQIEAKDANKFQEVLATVQEKIKEFVGDNETVPSAITALTAAPADAIVSGFQSVVEGVSNAGEAAADAVSDAASDAKDAVTDKANEMKDAAKEKTSDAIDAAADAAKNAIGAN